MILKVKLICPEDKTDLLTKELEEKGFTIDENADYIFLDKTVSEKKYIFAKDAQKNISLIEFDQVIYFESFNKITEVVTSDKRLEVKEKLYELEQILVMKDFIRANKSTVINMLMIEKIIPWIGSKFVLDMKNGDQIEVTRTYFSDFKKRLGM
ncbi:LytTR family transcriptional regulator [Acidaminobacter sp. JC074]|uniref:LytTR family DNA-binding domain-containing protein n=1 Tax=Acidaminobacter sp. JC074 TaxID=2530199 RepID=UPI001F101B39|nr:LytTR family DNA-binding domain-containing protein [Acidaminobacter sp. JC074]MCH4886462.1 LytTR family transcriptional regulator [Acidaminobacter sp. JC074]